MPPFDLSSMPADDDLRAEIAATAARLIAEEGCEYAQAKRRAVRELMGDERTSAIPDNGEVERELRRYLPSSKPRPMRSGSRDCVGWPDR